MDKRYLEPSEITALKADIKERKQFELPGSNYRASFYINEKGEKVLTSYYTEVCKIGKRGKFTRLWKDYSLTTLKHVNTFRSMNGLTTISKKEWESL